MCGIAAVWGSRDPKLAEQILSRISHRGPDGAGVRVLSNAVLGHRRLAIIDPAGGRQPMVTDDGSGLVANGMIYNFKRLREELASRFATASDSEVILHSVVEAGPQAVSDLDGMFAFAFADDERIVAARDPLGIKPLYVGSTDGALCFASEVKALADVADTVREFPPGHVFSSDRGLRRYYRLPGNGPDDLGEDEAVGALRTTLVGAVQKRLQSDVPLGAFLSGGLDSSIVAAVAGAYVSPLHTFSVGLEGSPDLHAARRMAAHIGSVHHERVITPDEIRARLPAILYHLESFDVDLVRSAVPTFFVAELASQYVKVVLTGEGADELFAGYRYHADYDDDSLHPELVRSLGAMHNVNLQRVDRMTMAHGLEARVPFLDADMVSLGCRIPVALKRRERNGGRCEKWILRQAFADLLPEDIAWRQKQQFDEGTGIADLLGDMAEQRLAEEATYRRLLAAQFESPEKVLGLVARWSDRRTPL